jgi:hypothetical protein
MMMPLRNRHITQSVRCVRADTYWPHTLYLPWGGAEGGRGGGDREREDRERARARERGSREGEREEEEGGERVG